MTSMRTFAPNQLVDLWERAEEQPPWQKALTILAALDPDYDPEQIASWPLGYRDRMLFMAHTQQFGPWIEVQGNCAHCAERIDFKFHADAVLEDDPGESVARYSLLENNGYRIKVRPPTTQDLLAVAGHREPGKALQEQLIGEIMTAGNSQIILDRKNVAHLSEVIELHLCKVQPLSEVSINARCPECGGDTPHLFDILDHLWRRIAAEVRRLLWDVHLLARAYGWSGKEILDLSPARRRQHIAMVMG